MLQVQTPQYSVQTAQHSGTGLAAQTPQQSFSGIPAQALTHPGTGLAAQASQHSSTAPLQVCIIYYRLRGKYIYLYIFSH